MAVRDLSHAQCSKFKASSVLRSFIFKFSPSERGPSYVSWGKVIQASVDIEGCSASQRFYSRFMNQCSWNSRIFLQWRHTTWFIVAKLTYEHAHVGIFTQLVSFKKGRFVRRRKPIFIIIGKMTPSRRDMVSETSDRSRCQNPGFDPPSPFLGLKRLNLKHVVWRKEQGW